MPQTIEDFSFLKREIAPKKSVILPERIKNDILGIQRAVENYSGINKFLFYGAPGTGKTECARFLSILLNRELYFVNFSSVIDYKLGQTQKNIDFLFNTINGFSHPEKVFVVFDEIDALALDRINGNDLREMGRSTSAVLKGFDYLSDSVVVVATTNLYDKLDNALKRRFDYSVDFDCYSKEDLFSIGESILSSCLEKNKKYSVNKRLFRKILDLMGHIPLPGDLDKLIRTSVAFGESSDEFGYLKSLYSRVSQPLSVFELSKKGFTVRDIEILTGISKSTVSRILNDGQD